MKKIYLIILPVILFTVNLNAQLTGTKSIPGDYATISAAVTDLNTQGVGAGGVIFNVAGGHTETLTAALILTISTNPPSSTRPVVFQRSGAGANPLITAFTPGVSATVDGIFIINGADYITIDGIDLQENGANATPTQQMEWGYALVKTSASNGSHYNTIKNCTVTLNKGNTASVGIYIGNHLAVNTTSIGLSTFQGTSSYNKFYSNIIQNSFHGIDLNGYTSATPYDFYDQGNEIGRDGVGPNTQILNFGGGAVGTANGITTLNQNNVSISYTTIDNTVGAATSTSLNGILLGTANNASVDVHHVNITLASLGTTTALNGINNTAGSTGAGNIININNCTITGCTYATATSAEFRGIAQMATASYTNINNNTITNNTLPGTGQFSAIFYGGSSATLCLNVNLNNNTISGNTKTGTSGQFNCIYASVAAFAINTFSNIVFNNSASATAGGVYGYFNNSSGPAESITNNQFYNITGGSGETIIVYARSGSFPTDKTVSGNIIHDITGAAQVGGILYDYGTVSNIFKNNIYNLTSTAAATSPGVYGITIGNSSSVNTINNIYNNFISDLKTPSSTSTGAVYGLWIQGTSVSSCGIYNNTIYLNAGSSSVTSFGTAGVFLASVPLSIDFRNNIVVNNSVPGPTGGNTVALLRNTTSLTNYGLASGFNCLYAGAPAANRLIYNDGTNSDQTVQAFKNRVGPREQASFSELPPFVNIAAAPYDLHLLTGSPTQCEKGGKVVALVTTDYDGDARNATTPDVGADELAGTTTDIASPDIQYTLLGNSGVAANRAVPAFASITDPSGINSTAGTKPRLYYKKTTQANTFNNNTNATDGWKYVEASNAASPFTFTINYTLLLSGSVVNGDIIQYFVTAQDLNATPRIGLNNGGFTTQPASVSLAAVNFPLNNTINQYNIVANTYTGIIPVGPAETITSLTNAGGIFSLISTGSVTGNITISITGDLTAETGTNALTQWAESEGSGYTISIVPGAAATRTISGSNAALSLIRLDGADRVTIDGRFGGSGSYLTFRNTSNAAPTIGFLNDAQNNTVRNSIIESGNTSVSATTGGAVFFGTTTGTQGNDNNTITENEIRDRSDVAGTPAIGINCAGNITTPTHANSGITISNNNIHDWFLLNGTSQFGIQVTTGNTNFSITGNSFYQTATRTNTVAGAITRAINITNAAATTTTGGYDITGNFIGGTAPGATGTDWILTAAVSQNFGAISVTTGLIPTSIQNNTIRRISFTTNAPAAAATVFFGISVTQGIFNIGTITGNTIGSSTVNGSITLTVNAGGAVSNFLAGILSASTNGYSNVNNNTIGGWTIGGTTISGAIIPQYIQIQGTPSQNFTVSNNLVGSTTIANSIQNNATAAPCVAFGIRLLITTGPSVTLSNNIIQNVTDNSVASSTADYGILLINTVGGTAPLTVTNNIVKDFAGSPLGAAPVINVIGLSLQGYSGRTHNFTGNTFSGISNTNTGAGSGYTMGLQVQGNSTGGTISKNKIFDIRNANTGAGPGLAGIYFSAGDGWNVSNNMISINNGAGANGLNVFGIAEYCNGAFNMYYNSVYIGGTNSGAINSYAFQRGNSSRVNLKNNILYNERSGGTGLNYAVGNNSATPANGWTNASSSYNSFITSSPATTGEWGAGVSRTFAQWKTSSAGDAESFADINTNIVSPSLFTNTGTGDLHILNNNCWFNGSGTPIAAITTDYDNQARDATTPDMGADEFTATYSGTLAGVAGAPTCESKTVSATGTTYSTNACNLIARVSPSGASQVSGNINVCVTLDATQQYFNGAPYVQRHMDIEPATNAATATGTVTLYFTNAEFVSYNTNNPVLPPLPTAAGGGSADPNRANLKITQYHGTATTSPSSPGNYTGAAVVIIPNVANITWNGSYWSVSFDVNGFSGFYAYTSFSAGPLPITINYFNGTKQGSNHLLNWKVTCNSTPRATMILERSADSRNFSPINSITADAARCNQPFDYTDTNPLAGMNYYRLKIVDADGKISYSGIVALLNAVKGFEIISIAPNPVVTDNFTLNVTSAQAAKMELLIIDMQGRLVNRQTISLIAGFNSLPVNVGNLAAGTYTIQGIIGDDKSKVTRFVKQ